MIRRYVAIIPLFAAAAFVLLAVYWQERLPEPVAIHFGVSGRADGFLEFWPSVLLNAFLIALPAIVTVLLSKGLKDKSLLGVFLWLPIGLTGIFFAISGYLLFIQLDLPAAEAASLDANFFLLVLSPIVLVMLLLLRKPKIQVGENAVVVSSLGLDMLRIPYSEIVGTSIQHLRPRDFGGWGLRVNLSGDVAFLPSAGEAISIERASAGKILIRTDNSKELKNQIERKLA